MTINGHEELVRLILQESAKIEHWFNLQWLCHTPPFYASVDIRNAGFKLSVVDTNLFPGGFNNLDENALKLAKQAICVAVERRCHDACRFLLIPESFTRNTHYLSNVARLTDLLRQSGLDVRIGTLIPEIKQPTLISNPDGSQLLFEPLKRRGDRLYLDGFDPCAILFNSDLSTGIPPILQGIKGQYIIPQLYAGWWFRRKSRHFIAYSTVVKQFAELLLIDPWVLDPFYATCSEVNFHTRKGESCLADNISMILEKTRVKYRELGIQETPYVVVKADAGTYGMGIMIVKDAKEIINLNRKQRNKMAVIKEGLLVSDVLIQEGVPTIEKVNEAVAESVVYMIDRFVLGGFYRIHPERSPYDNLNCPGMKFLPIPFDKSCIQVDPAIYPKAALNGYYVYEVIARLALLAASLELEQNQPGP